MTPSPRRPARIGLLLDRFDPARGGAETYADAFLRRAVEKGHETFLACAEGVPPPGVVAVDVPTARTRRRPARDVALARDGERALRERGVDVVVAFRHATACDVYFPHGGLVEDAWAAEDASRGGAGFFRRLAASASKKRAFFRESERTLLGAESGPRVIALSRALAARIASRYPSARTRTTVVPNGVDADRFDPAKVAGARAVRRRALGLAPDAYVGLHVAHRPWLKGLPTALEAMARPEGKDLHLLCVGRTEPALARLARRLGVAARVRFLGPAADVRPVYAAADLLVHPTWHDPCSLVCLEAAAMALPVVTTPADGFSELMGRRAGIVVERPGDAGAVATAVAVLSEARLRAETAEDARYLAVANRLATRLDQALDVCRAAAR